MMKRLANWIAGTKAYPYRERLPIAGGWLILIWILTRFSNRSITTADELFLGSLFFVLLFRPRERAFWFFAGVAIGATTLQLLSQMSRP
jgi:hypothetical protein